MKIASRSAAIREEDHCTVKWTKTDNLSLMNKCRSTLSAISRLRMTIAEHVSNEVYFH